jgi:predicted Abi (CAAX) family protease
MHWQAAMDAPFLILVTGASTVATVSYYLSGGSLWAAWVAHLLLVLPWIIYAGKCIRHFYLPLPSSDFHS